MISNFYLAILIGFSHINSPNDLTTHYSLKIGYLKQHCFDISEIETDSDINLR